MGRNAALYTALLLVLCGGAPVRADDAEQQFGRGLSAFNAGDFAAALDAWTPLADSDDPRAEAGLGFMYHRGLGVTLDDDKAALWLRRAAEQGQAEGQLMLGILYFYGTGVPQSYAHAYAWCELAADYGQSDAEMCRDAALQSMTGDDQTKGFGLLTDLRERYGRKR